MTHREIAIQASIVHIFAKDENGNPISASKMMEAGIAFADTFERIYAEHTKAPTKQESFEEWWGGVLPMKIPNRAYVEQFCRMAWSAAKEQGK